MGRGSHKNHKKAADHYKWNSALFDSMGYRLVRLGCEHPLADPNGYAREHRVVLEAAGIDTVGKIIHHKNGDRTDNRFSNLEVMTKAEHNRIHNQNKTRNKKGRFQKAGRKLDGRTHDNLIWASSSPSSRSSTSSESSKSSQPNKQE